MNNTSATSLEREHRAGALFLAAAELTPVQCKQFLLDVGKSDPGLRSEVEALLEADRKNSGGFLRAPLGEVRPPEREVEPAAPLPTSIGPYRVLSELGCGEHAVVYLARQEEPIERLVAIKVLRHHRGSQEVLQRFETERRILALMEHPNITRLFEAGVTSDGRAYFVMEYVHGGPVSTYCRDQALPLRQRLRLFCDICRAVEHAHQRGIIHRDLKPTNILVAAGADGEATVKVIDFGVARAAGAGLYSFPSHTQHGQLVGTVAYMSPEQIGGDGLLVDTRSDVYGLGAVLYEVVCDAPAFNTTEAGAATIISRITLNGPPAARTIRHALPLDVDAILRKAMERDPSERYQSVAGLRLDIERFLSGRAVESRAARPVYLFRKFISRHRIAVGLLLIVAAGLLAAVAQKAVLEGEKFDLAVNLAQAGFDHTRHMAKTAGERGRRKPLLVVLDAQSENLLVHAPNHPGVLHLRADVLGAMGDLELEDGKVGSAKSWLEGALAIRSQLVERYPDNVTFRMERSVATVRVGDAALAAGESETAEQMYLNAMDMDERMYALRPGLPRAITLLAWSCDRLACFANRHKDVVRAEGLFARSLDLMKKLCTVENSADARRGLSNAHIHAGDSARRRGDDEGLREHVARALEEAEAAIALTPDDRLARWGYLSVRTRYLLSRRDLLSPAEADAYSDDTLKQARRLADLDTTDVTMHYVLTHALAVGSECAERCNALEKAVALRDEHVQECRHIFEQQPSCAEARMALESAIAEREQLLLRHRVDTNR